MVQEEFDKRFNQVWHDSYGFQNAYSLTVTATLAEKEVLQTASDIEKIAYNLTRGLDNPWLNRAGDGYEGFFDAYGFTFREAIVHVFGACVPSGE